MTSFLNGIIIENVFFGSKFSFLTVSTLPKPIITVNLNEDYGFENAVYSVFDITGKRVLNDRFYSNTIDVSELSSGNYILRVMHNGVIKTQKFIKQ